MAIKLDKYQIDAVNKLRNGNILVGGVGSGKSLTAIAYYFTLNGGNVDPYIPMDDIFMRPLYIITTAKKRDSKEWEGDLAKFFLSPDDETINIGQFQPTIDSWNNIGKYENVKDAFFIFDEQRLVGNGAWVKSFHKIAKSNAWILLTATPGDKWEDYAPVFIANGFYRNITEFRQEHVVYNYRFKFPKVDRYLNTRKLARLKESIVVVMEYENPTELVHKEVFTKYNKFTYKLFCKERVDLETGEPIESASEFCYKLRKIVNSDPSRIEAVREIMETTPRIIIFYNFDYELEMLKDSFEGEIEIGEWNGHKHQDVPEGARWLYLVQYNAGAEGWNCIRTDTIIFFSQNYSYKMTVQAAGRIDRRTTPYSVLYYYHLKSTANIDLAIATALRNKKKFNEGKFTSKLIKRATEKIAA
jgi:hypothetical protein